MTKNTNKEIVRGKGRKATADDEWGPSLIAATAKGPGTFAGELLAVERLVGGVYGEQYRFRVQCDDGQGRIVYTGSAQVAEAIAPYVGSRVKLTRTGTKLETRWNALAARGAKRTDYAIRDVAARVAKPKRGARKPGRGKK